MFFGNPSRSPGMTRRGGIFAICISRPYLYSVILSGTKWSRTRPSGGRAKRGISPGEQSRCFSPFGRKTIKFSPAFQPSLYRVILSETKWSRTRPSGGRAKRGISPGEQSRVRSTSASKMPRLTDENASLE